MRFGQTTVPPANDVASAAWNLMGTKVGYYPETGTGRATPILTLGVAGGLRTTLDKMAAPAREIADSIGAGFPLSQANEEKRFQTAYEKHIGPGFAKILATVVASHGSPLEKAALALRLANKTPLPLEDAKAFWAAAGRYAIHLKVYLSRPVESKYARAWGSFKEAWNEAPGVIGKWVEAAASFAAEILASIAAGIAGGAAKGLWKALRPWIIGGVVVVGVGTVGYLGWRSYSKGGSPARRRLKARRAAEA